MKLEETTIDSIIAVLRHLPTKMIIISQKYNIYGVKHKKKVFNTLTGYYEITRSLAP